MSMDHLKDPEATSWTDLKGDLRFTPAEQEEIRNGAHALIAQSRAFRLAEVRRRQHATQVDIAKAMGLG